MYRSTIQGFDQDFFFKYLKVATIPKRHHLVSTRAVESDLGEFPKSQSAIVMYFLLYHYSLLRHQVTNRTSLNIRRECNSRITKVRAMATRTRYSKVSKKEIQRTDGFKSFTALLGAMAVSLVSLMNHSGPQSSFSILALS